MGASSFIKRRMVPSGAAPGLEVDEDAGLAAEDDDLGDDEEAEE